MATIFTAQNNTTVVVPWRADLAGLIPHARAIDFKGERMLVMPNGPDETRLCRNLGLLVPSPVLTRYEWPVVHGRAPWEAQKLTTALLVENPAAYVLSTMGTGKTRAVIYACDYLLKMGIIKKVLISAPLSTLTEVWERELFATLPLARVKVLYGDRAKRLTLLDQDAEFYIINHHGLPMLKTELAAKGFDVGVIDELAVFRNKSTELWKGANAVLESTTYKWGLTGAPTPTEPVDAWAQIRLITPTRVARTVGSFRDATMKKISQFRWVPRPDANQIVHASMQPSIRFTRDDVEEIPPTTYVDRQVKLDPMAEKAYKLLFNKMRMKTDDGRSITAVNEGVLHGKLLQVSCGYIYADDKTVYSLPNAARMQGLLETVAECDRKVLVFVPYVHALDGVADSLRRAGHTVGVISGSVGRAARDKIFRDFRQTDDPRIIAAHPATMAHGLNLTEADTIIWYSPYPHPEIYEQANARVPRPGQRHKTLIVHLIATAVERRTVQRLRGQLRMQGLLMDLFHNQEVLL